MLAKGDIFLPQISIIITAYNVQDYIATAILSALNQQAVLAEVVVIVDGATDNTAEIVNSLKLKYPQLHVVVKTNGGVSSARNLGLQLSTAEYLMFLDGDDQLLPDACHQFIAAATLSDADIVVSDYLTMKEGSTEKRLKTASGFSPMTGADFATAILAPQSTVSVWNKCYKRSLFKDVSFPEEISMGEDLLTLFDVSLKAKKVVPLPAPTLIYTIRQSSLANSSSQHLLSITLVMELLKKRLQNSWLTRADADDIYQATAFYHVMFARVVREERFGEIHQQLFNWYNTNFNGFSNRTKSFIKTLSIKEQLLILIYHRSYSLAVAIVHINAFLRKVFNFSRSLFR